MDFPIDLQEDGRNFVIVRTDEGGTETRMSLAADDVLTLARSAQSLQDRILARHSPTGAAAYPVTPMSAIPIAGGQISFDPLHGVVLLTLRERDGRLQTLSVPVEIARALHRELPRWIGEAERASARKPAN